MRHTVTVKEQIFMENALRRIGNANLNQIKALLRPYIGQKVLKQDGSLLQKIKDQIEIVTIKPEPLRPGGFTRAESTYVRSTAYSIWLNVTVNFSGGKYENNTYYCEYREATYFLADIKNGCILEKVQQDEDLDMLDAEQEERSYNLAVEAKKAFAAAKDQVHYCLNEMLKAE